MATLLQVTKKLQVIPLIDLRHARFAQGYELGLWWCLFGEREGEGSLPDSYLINNLKTCAVHDWFHEQDDRWLHWWVGFCIGMIHGGVLTPMGQLRPDVTTLVKLRNQDFTEGYRRGRYWFFGGSEDCLPIATDDDLLARLKGHAEENLYLCGEDDVLYWAIGCILGDLSGHLFPQDQAQQELIIVELSPIVALQEA